MAWPHCLGSPTCPNTVGSFFHKLHVRPSDVGKGRFPRLHGWRSSVISPTSEPAPLAVSMQWQQGVEGVLPGLATTKARGRLQSTRICKWHLFGRWRPLMPLHMFLGLERCIELLCYTI